MVAVLFVVVVNLGHDVVVDLVVDDQFPAQLLSKLLAYSYRHTAVFSTKKKELGKTSEVSPVSPVRSSFHSFLKKRTGRNSKYIPRCLKSKGLPKF